ncbi:peroxiredoxin [Asticcacaulis sp. BYS171W]|uniref:thioredoxin-dependent peroxiredoxin n=1 Tax=Asticcacaulis aquaticus TaxID=2984212 RepID=A0ABT5HNR7_9CAUL|nr:peroxiredoxin [Asticcacaulis aquaticus]MDC7681705.1 peroxiredoxin [Asticcacaulis aquaticus]
MAKKTTPATEFKPYPAPDFALPSDEGKSLSLKDLAGKWVVLFLYPTDNTPTCTQEALDFTAAAPDFAALGATVIGLSKDDLKSHARFRAKHSLTMPLLSDESTTTIAAFGSWGEKSLYGRAYMGTDRSTFLIDPQGQVRAEWRKVRLKGHVQAVLDTLRLIQNT